MRRFILTLTALVAMGITRADDNTVRGDELYEQFVNYSLSGQTDRIMAEKDAALRFFEDNEQWEHYYFVANLAIQTRVVAENQPVTGLRECRRLYEFARDHHDDYGRASILAQIGWLYGYIGDHDEGVRQMKQAFNLFRRQPLNRDIISLYYYYAYMLETAGMYQDEARVLSEVRPMVDNYQWKDTTLLAYRAYHDNLLNAETLLEVRLGHLDEAARLVACLENKLARSDEFNPYEALRATAEYYLARREYDRALSTTDQMLTLPAASNERLLWGLNLLRTRILRELGRGNEAYDILSPMVEQRNSANMNELRHQLSEMDSLAEIDEMRVREQRAHFWYAVIVSLIIIVSLTVFAVFRQIAARVLARKNRELAEALDHAQESDRMKTAFVQHVSHEIRTPLNIITGFAQVVGSPEYELSDDDRRKMLADISHNTNEITSLVNELLELSESESQSHYAKTDDVDISALCQTVLSESEVENPAHLRMSLDDSLPRGYTLRSNADALHKILTRLMSNALKFTEQGSVVVRTRAEAGRLVIEVEDTGIGIAPENRDKVFERFFKVDAFKPGIGLGLTVARRTAELLDGMLTLDPAYTTGSRFVLSLPITDTEK